MATGYYDGYDPNKSAWARFGDFIDWLASMIILGILWLIGMAIVLLVCTLLGGGTLFAAGALIVWAFGWDALFYAVVIIIMLLFSFGLALA